MEPHGQRWGALPGLGPTAPGPPILHKEPCSQLLRLFPQTCSGLSFECLSKDIIKTALGEADPF